MGNPEKNHWEASKWVQILGRNKKKKKSLLYKLLNTTSLNLVGYLDLEFVGDIDIWRSLIGYAFQFGGNTVNWKLTLSTMEAKFITLIEVVKEAKWLQKLLKKLWFRSIISEHPLWRPKCSLSHKESLVPQKNKTCRHTFTFY